MAQFIIARAYFQLVNAFSHKAYQMIHIIDSDSPFDVVFKYFLGQGDIPDRDGYHKILTCMGCMTGFALVAASGLKKIK